MLSKSEKLFIRAYVEAALWSETDGSEDSPEPLDSDYEADDITLASACSIVRDCLDFYRAHEALLSPDPAQAGHDFLLTRNRHGAGFWDGDYPTAVGRLLADASHVYGDTHFYIGDDGRVHVA